VGEQQVRTVYRYEVAVDDKWHEIPMYGRPSVNPVLHVAARKPDVVEFWAEYRDWEGFEETRWFRVFGTGQPFPNWPMHHRGVALAADGQLVWHLYESEGMPPP